MTSDRAGPVLEGPPLLSLITVVKDDPEGFLRTLDSVRAQQIEALDRGGAALLMQWVVIDSSADRHSIPGKLEGLTQPMLPDIDYEWLPASGVYPAMNAGLNRAAGDYVMFMNAGDSLHGSDAVQRIVTSINENATPPAWLYGQVCFVSTNGERTVPTPFDYAREQAASFSRGRFPPHQGTIARRDLVMRLGGFDTSYRIAADYALFLRLSMLADPVEIDEVIADFTTGGLSTLEWRESLTEFHRARREILRPTGRRSARESLETRFTLWRMSLARMLGRT